MKELTQTIADETKRKILRAYLGFFYGKVSDTEKRDFALAFPEFKSAMVLMSPLMLRKAGWYYLMNWGKQNYRFLYTYNLIDFYLKTPVAGEDDDQTFYDDHTPLLILYHMANTMENRQLENIVGHTVSVRHLAGKVTLLLCESNLPQLRSWFELNKQRTVELKGTLSRGKTKEL